MVRIDKFESADRNQRERTRLLKDAIETNCDADINRENIGACCILSFECLEAACDGSHKGIYIKHLLLEDEALLCATLDVFFEGCRLK